MVFRRFQLLVFFPFLLLMVCCSSPKPTRETAPEADDPVQKSETELLDALRRSEKDRALWFNRLELLGSLRRLQGKPEPLTLQARPVWGQRSYDWPDPIEAEVTVTNSDPEAISFPWHSPYENHWRFEVRNEQGEELPIQVSDLRNTRGLSRVWTLESGQSWSGRLRMYCYMSPLPPGNYQIRVQYCPTSSIAELSDLRGYLVFQSEAFPLTIKASDLWNKAEQKRKYF